MLGFGTLLALTLLLACTVYTQLKRIEKDKVTLKDDALPGLTDASEILEQSLQYRIITLKHIASDDDAEMAALDKAADKKAEEVVALLSTYEKAITQDEDRANFAKVAPAIQGYRDVAKRIRALSTERKNKEAMQLVRS